MKPILFSITKKLLFFFFLFSFSVVFAQDSDGDGVLDATEITDGTNEFDTCSYLVASITETINFKDCDSDGLTDEEEITGVDDTNTAANPNGYITNPLLGDTDGDTVNDGQEAVDLTNPNSPCSYLVASITNAANLGTQDCDSDGLTDNEEITGVDDLSTPRIPTGISNPLDACDPIDGSSLTDTDSDGLTNCEETSGNDNPNTPLAPTGISDPNDHCDPIETSSQVDTDGDGLTDCEENTGQDNLFTNLIPTRISDPIDPCDPIEYSPLTDTDGDGLADCEETSGQDNPNTLLVPTGTSDSSDPCDPYSSSLVDTDGDGLTNCEETSGQDNSTTPANPNGYTSNFNKYDTDGDGVNDGDGSGLNIGEAVDGTDPTDTCDFNVGSITITPTSLCLGNTITGIITFDQNANGCDTTDISVPRMRITATNGTNVFSTFSRTDGTYSLNVNEGNFIISIDNVPYYFTTAPNTINHNFVGINNSFTADFCLTTTQTINDVSITTYAINPRPGFKQWYALFYKNEGTTVLNGDVSLEYDNAKLTLHSANETIANQTSNTVNFNYTNLQPFESRIIYVVFTVATIPTVNLGDNIQAIATVNPIAGDNIVANNTSIVNKIVIGSYDPNDIHVLEGSAIKLANTNTYLHYTIRFQNTGTAAAQNVLVTNVLDANLDWSTLQLETMSHPGEVAIYDNNQIKFIFDNIDLPDSTNDEPNSHGFISYKIKPKTNISIGEEMTNNAHIFFDFNPKIDTNIITTVVEANNTASTNNAVYSNWVSLYPNPVNSKLYFSTTSNSLITKVVIYSSFGKKVLEKTATAINNINVSKLNTGIYFVKIINNKEEQVLYKIVVN